MSVSRSDEIDLLVPLHDGLHETPRWQTFLSRFRRRTGADHASLILGQGTISIYHAPQWSAGHDVRAEARTLEELACLDPIPYHRFRPGRVYAASEMIDAADPKHQRFSQVIDRLGLRFGRLMRVTAAGGLNAWLTIGRNDLDFHASHGSLLSSLAPHLSVVLHTFGLLEQARYRAATANELLARTGIGWNALDRDGALVAQGGIDTGDASQDDTERLHLPVHDEPLVASAMPSRLSLSRIPIPLGLAQQTALAAQYRLSRKEAALACALAEGQKLTEAATALGITPETARNYSKLLYAKTGTRGQAELVAKILRGTAILADRDDRLRYPDGTLR